MSHSFKETRSTDGSNDRQSKPGDNTRDDSAQDKPSLEEPTSGSSTQDKSIQDCPQDSPQDDPSQEQSVRDNPTRNCLCSYPEIRQEYM